MTGNELRELISTSPTGWQRTFYGEYKNYVYTVVFNRLRCIANIEDIEECVSDVFADIFMQTERLLRMDELVGIVGLIAKRKAIGYYRRLSEKYGRADLIDALTSDEDMVADIERYERSRALLRLVNELGEPDSQIILLSYYYGLTSQQIGEKLQMKSAAVRKRASRAIKKLREKLSEVGLDEREWQE